MSRPRARSRDAIVALAGAALLLAGCATVPTSGAIHRGNPVLQGDQELIYRSIPQPPRPGMSADEVVRAFLAASSSGSDAYGVARLFLTATAARSWDPRASVRVYDASGIQTKVVGPAVEVSGVLDGTIGSDGGYTVAAGGQRLEASYRLVKVGPEWRISDLPPGLVLGRGDVDREFRTYNLYYLDPSFSVMVPDPVTVPVIGPGLATGLVQALLTGPTRWLAPAVRTAFPEGTTLVLDAVPVDSGIAQVELSSQVLSADDKTRQALSAQLVWTLRGLPNVTGVRITVNGQPLSVPGAGQVQSSDQWQGYDAEAATGTGPAAYAGTRTGLVHRDDSGELASVPGPLGTGRPLLVAPAVSPDRSRIAGVSPDRRELWVQSLTEADAPVRLISDGIDLSSPTWDRTGALWVVDRGGRGVVRVVDGREVAVPIAALPAGTEADGVVGISISPDGTRAGLLLRRARGVEPWLARVERDGTTVRLAAPRRVETVVAAASAVGWNGVDQLAVLGTDGSNLMKLYFTPLGFGQVSSQNVPDGASTLAVRAGEPILIGAAGRLYTQSGGSWTPAGDATDPSYSG